MTSPPEGYEVVEFRRLNSLMSNKDHQGLATAVLAWIADELQTRFDPRREFVQIDVIKVKYIGPYPALGVRYLTERSYDDDTLSAAIKTAGADLLNEQSIAKFLSFVGNNDQSWEQTYRELKVPGSQYYDDE